MVLIEMKYLALDLGGSSIKTALVDENYNITKKMRYVLPTSLHTNDALKTMRPDEIILPIMNTAEDFIEVVGTIYDKVKDEISGIAISCCCPVDSTTGVIYMGGTYIYLNNINLPQLLEKRCPVKITVEKDSNCMLLGETSVGNLQGYQNAIALGVGTGVACGVMINGNVLKGTHNMAGEVSTLLVTESENLSYENCWFYKNGITFLIGQVAAKKQCEPDSIDGIEVFRLIREKDKDALEALEEYSFNYAKQIYNLQMIFDVEAFAICGAASQQTILIDTINRKLNEIQERLKFLKYVPEIKQSKHANDSNLIGAVIAFKNSYTVETKN